MQFAMSGDWSLESWMTVMIATMIVECPLRKDQVLLLRQFIRTQLEGGYGPGIKINRIKDLYAMALDDDVT